MRSALDQIYLHFVWATWDRLPILTEDVRDAVFQVILDKCKSFDAAPLALNGVEDHVHLLVRLNAKHAPARFIGEVKGASSHFITHERRGEFFKWQGAYGVFSVDEAGVANVQQYIRNQQAHHHQPGKCYELRQIAEIDNGDGVVEVE